MPLRSRLTIQAPINLPCAKPYMQAPRPCQQCGWDCFGPQALKLVIPGIANTFLALVKDTPLIFVVGLLELVGMLNLAKTNPKWLGFSMEGYVFAGIIFWIICYSMSKYSQSLELKYKTDR